MLAGHEAIDSNAALLENGRHILSPTINASRYNQAVREFAAGGAVPSAVTQPAHAGGVKTIKDPATETTEQLCAVLPDLTFSEAPD